jgi:hypothetical protein
MPTCDARNQTPPYHLCDNPVSKAGERRHHKGLPAKGPRPTKAAPKRGRSTTKKAAPRRKSRPATTAPYPTTSSRSRAPSPAAQSQLPRQRSTREPKPKRPETLTEREQKRVETAVEFSADILTEGWQETVADHAADCIHPKTWNRLFRGRRRRDCRALADLAKAILEGKKKLHQLIGAVGAWFAREFGGDALEEAVARELSQRIHIPVVDDKAVVVARSLQMIGIALCLSRGDPLSRCQSFIDLALAETKERVKQTLVVALEDWTTPSDRLVSGWATAPAGRTAAL